ncbi:hypothetical protein [Rossellomorea arthrocnemi]|uniref:hypothetical protein n=1 Tax=Rossellomorea arthrocnemi TaxID=2769542 RepID=UPI00191AA18E|nr:hypothetical protein [Rossellomorea arthrocnemi]
MGFIHCDLEGQGGAAGQKSKADCSGPTSTKGKSQKAFFALWDLSIVTSRDKEAQLDRKAKPTVLARQAQGENPKRRPLPYGIYPL